MWRDGAAAQYGSDAISGVINIVLKKQTGHTNVSLEGGQASKGDGLKRQGSVNTGLKLGRVGHLDLTPEYRKRDATNRAGLDRPRVDPPSPPRRLGDADAKDACFWLDVGLPVAGGESPSSRMGATCRRRAPCARVTGQSKPRTA